MKIAYRLFLFLLISAFLFSCGEKKAGVEGKLLNGRGQPLSGITLIFKQVQPSKGYEQLETKTLADGAFRIDGVMPASEYIIAAVSDNWKTKVTTKITTLSEGQSLVLSRPIVIRFNVMKDATIVDTKTGLQWLILSIPDLNSSNVLNAVKNIKEGGFTDWRLPTKVELSELQETPAAPTTQPETGLVQKSCCAWVAEPNTENIEWKFYVDDGNDVWASSKVTPEDRIVIVRNSTPAAPSAQTPAAAIPAAVTAAPAANLVPEKKQAPEPAPPVMEKKDIPAVKSKNGVLKASRKACIAKKTQTTKSPATAAAPITAAPAKQSPSAKVSAPQPNNAMGDSINIQFAMNKSVISPEELSKLKAFYAKIKGKKGKIIIEGNAASDGDAAYSFKISGDRALSVKAMLHKLGLSNKADVKITALSDTKSIADNTTEAGRILNRRADVTFIPE